MEEVDMHIVEQPHTYWKAMAGFAKVLFPTDFSPSANRALEVVLGLSGVREVIIQHVVSTYFEKHPHWVTLFDIHEMQKYMDMYVETEMAKIPRQAEESVQYRTVVSEGKPAQQIVELAEKEHVDIILMGPAKGQITGQVIRASSRPVLAIPHNDVPAKPLGKISKVLVTTDLSPYSKAVVDYAFQLQRLIGCDLFVLYVIELSSGIRFGVEQGYFSDAVSKMRDWARTQLENLIPKLPAEVGSIRPLVEQGPISDTIAACARDSDADLVILGAHGYGPVERHFVGTTTDKVLTNVLQPVLVVKI
jgi:nucleotide-binding universal stress UspA family protein